MQTFIRQIVALSFSVLPFAACHQSGGVGGENTLTECSDGVDNDGDNAIDCADPECTSFRHCSEDSDWDTGSEPTDDTESGDTDSFDGTDSGGLIIYERWVTLPAGSFWMGSPDGECPEGYPASCVYEFGRNDFEGENLHYVTITRPFEMMRYEVTQGEFAAVFENNPSYFGPNGGGPSCGVDCPVDMVNWYEALAYANHLSEAAGLTPCYTLYDCTGVPGAGCDMDQTDCSGYQCGIFLNGVERPQDCEGYRLPTESEWEYAARAGSLTAFYPSLGNDGTLTDLEEDPNLDLIAWYGGNSDEGQGHMPHPVGQKAPNAWGLYDMIGNIGEWGWDLFGLYEKSSSLEPFVDPSGPPEPYYNDLNTFVGKGGGYTQWDTIPYTHLRSAARDFGSGSRRYVGAGFRLVRSIHE